MLEIKHVSKIYRSKKASPVYALDDVSVSFPNTGMVFLLGKSGSGKSTMLNVIGGLDAFDRGEIIIKGKSSKSFREKDFDSYRNTYIGFIFQDYNILEDFSVEKNIALALELQGKDASRNSVDAILEQVDLKGYGKRKPNQLSGGQKQRVAIARALIKNPEIIMADEPSGALDSTTGRQVFETLKKLSASRLVIIVSHDRDFAETYADRIIELKDGKILNDSSKRKAPIEQISDAMIVSGSTIMVQPGHKVTANEKSFIDKTLANNEHGVVISVDKEVNQNFKKFAKMDENGNREYFNDTKDEDVKLCDDKNFKLIRSRFKYWDSFKMGASGLKLKKVRLVFTILLAAFALMFFGVADTAGSFEASRSMHDSLVKAGSKSTAIIRREIEKHEDYTDTQEVRSSDSDVARLRAKFPSYSFVPVRDLGYDFGGRLNYHDTDKVASPGSYSYNYYQHSNTMYDFAEEYYQKFGFTLLGGRFPTNDEEVVITDYQLDNFKDLRYVNNTPGATQGREITSASGILHTDCACVNINTCVHRRVVSIGGHSGWTDLKIVGVIDTGFNFTAYDKLKNPSNDDRSLYMKFQEFSDVLNYGFHNALFLKEGYFTRNTVGETRTGIPGNFQFRMQGADSNDVQYMSKVSELAESGVVFFENGKSLSTLAANEVIVHHSVLREAFTDTYTEIGIHNSGPSFSINMYHRFTWASIESGDYNTVEGFRDGLTDILRAYKDSLRAFSLAEFDNRFGGIKDSTELIIAGVYCDALTKDDAFFATNPSHDDYNENWYWGTVFMSNSFVPSAELAKAMEPPPPYKLIQVSLTGHDMALIKYLIQYKDGEFILKNQFSFFFETFAPAVASIAKVFIYIGAGFAAFASLMMMSFITMTINHKKREIGILRAIGAKKFDVFKIFFNESLIMAFLNFLVSVALTITAIILLNNTIGGGLGMSVVLLSFGVRQVALLAGVSLLVAIVASALPVRRISKLKPIDAIQNRK